MSIIDEIKEKFIAGRYEYSKHAVDQTILRHIRADEVKEAILSDSEVIEDYFQDKYGPSCLIYGLTENGRPLHVQTSYPARPIKIITVYEPDKNKWLNYRIRRMPL